MFWLSESIFNVHKHILLLLYPLVLVELITFAMRLNCQKQCKTDKSEVFMETKMQEYRQAVSAIEKAILHSQYRAAKMVTGEQLSLYYGIGGYVSVHSRQKAWGTSAIDSISEQLRRDLPGLRGFSSQNIRNMRSFFEYWSQYLICSPTASKLQMKADEKEIDIDSLSLQKWSPLASEISREEFLGISFSHHMEILHRTKELQEVLFYIRQTVLHKWDKYDLRNRLKENLYAKEGAAANNFLQTMPVSDARKAVSMFKDEYLLDYINVEEMEVDKPDDVDERVVEHAIVRNIKKFIMSFGRDFAYIGNQYHLEIYSQELFPDLLFLNRELNCMVVVELKKGAFKPGYVGQLQTYMKVLDDKIRKPHENPTIGILLCKSADKAFVEYVIRDYNHPMGVATYKTAQDMSEELRKALPDMDEMRRLLAEDEK
jgi:predicted nuclease of restriction endonuclease-like (RecB) superfamily